jgi:hypothetical protein
MEKEKNLTKIRLCHCGCKGALLNNENQFLSGHHIHYVRTPERNLKMKQILKRKWKDANYRNNVITGIKKALNTQEAKIKKSKISRQLWNDPQYREKVMNGLSPDVRKKIGRKSRSLWKTKEYRNKIIEKINNPEMLKKASERSKELWENNEFRTRNIEALNKPSVKKKQSEQAQKRWKNPNYRKTVIEKSNSYENRKRKSEKLSREKSHLWRGGVSFEPYSIEFNNTIRRHILKRDNNACQNPNCVNGKTSKHVHHIDYNKKNTSELNLITLCNNCHSSSNQNRKYHQAKYTSIVQLKYPRKRTN